MGDIEQPTSSSISDPASSPAAMAVGAYCVDSGTIDRSAAAARRSTAHEAGHQRPRRREQQRYGAFAGCDAFSGFFGTSASAPHVAGAAALLLGVSPNMEAPEVQQLLEDRAESGGSPDTSYGNGRLRLGPAGDATVATPQPFTPLAPVRAVRQPSRPHRRRRVAAAHHPDRPAGKVQVPVAGVAGVPADATAVVLNVTATTPTADGYVTVHPAAPSRSRPT